MPDSFNGPEVKATAAAGVAHRPGMAQQVLHELVPFLAEEGIDLNDPGSAGVEDINAAVARAVARYNASLPSAPPVPKSGRKRPPHRPGEPKLSQSDRSLARDFERWLRRQDEIAGPSVADESAVFDEVLKIAKQHDFRLRTPEDVEGLLDLLLDSEDLDDDTVNAAVGTLHDYVHFRMDTDAEAGWEEIDDLFDTPFPGSDILNRVIRDARGLDPDERRAALAETRLVTAVAELLDWIGTGRKLTPSGYPRLVDIAHAAGLLGIDAVGVNKPPPVAPDADPLFDVEATLQPPDALRVRSAKDVPLLPSWWRALSVAELIELNTYRVTIGPSAAEWTAESLPPLELAEMLVGLTVAQLIWEDLDRSVSYADRLSAILLARLLRALAPDEVGLPADDDEFDRMLDGIATKKLQRLESVGVLRPDSDEFVVPDALRGTVAQGVFAGVAMIRAALADG